LVLRRARSPTAWAGAKAPSTVSITAVGGRCSASLSASTLLRSRAHRSLSWQRDPRRAQAPRTDRPERALVRDRRPPRRRRWSSGSCRSNLNEIEIANVERLRPWSQMSSIWATASPRMVGDRPPANQPSGRSDTCARCRNRARSRCGGAPFWRNALGHVRGSARATSQTAVRVRLTRQLGIPGSSTICRAEHQLDPTRQNSSRNSDLVRANVTSSPSSSKAGCSAPISEAAFDRPNRTTLAPCVR
jgi:hypothetical protein